MGGGYSGDLEVLTSLLGSQDEAPPATGTIRAAFRAQVATKPGYAGEPLPTPLVPVLRALGVGLWLSAEPTFKFRHPHSVGAGSSGIPWVVRQVWCVPLL